MGYTRTGMIELGYCDGFLEKIHGVSLEEWGDLPQLALSWYNHGYALGKEDKRGDDE
jgi:hypothetical protein